MVIVINCVDGRVQTPVLEWARRTFGVALVHNVTEPGADGSLAAGDGARRIEPIVRLLATRGPITAICVVAHHDCLGHPVDEETHRAHLRRAADVVSSWGLSPRVVGVWVDAAWRPSAVCEAAGA